MLRHRRPHFARRRPRLLWSSSDTPGAEVFTGLPVTDPGPVHVHGLGINPADDALFIATHTGLFRVAGDSRNAARVADRYQDTMGFSVVGPNRFLGSGHPDAREQGQPPLLGLIQSTRRGRDVAADLAVRQRGLPRPADRR